MRNPLFILLVVLFVSCQKKQPVHSKTDLAKAFGYRLTLAEVLTEMPNNLNAKDSTEFIRSYINEWTKHKLLLNKALFNLSENETDIERVVEKYREDLYIELFVSNLTKQDLDTVITNRQLDSVYNLHQKMFLTRQPLLQFRYLRLSNKTSSLGLIKKKLKYQPEYIEKQLEINKNFTKYVNEEGLWFKWSHVLNLNPKLSIYNKTLKPGVVYQTEDDNGIHLIFVQKLVKEKKKAPLRVVLPTIKELILHQRKKALVNQLEKDLIEQATINKQIEIY